MCIRDRTELFDKQEKTVLFVSTGKDMGDATGQYAETKMCIRDSLMFCKVLPMQAQQMKKLTDLKAFERCV